MIAKTSCLMVLTACASLVALAAGPGLAAPVGHSAVGAALRPFDGWQPAQYHGSPRGRFIDEAARQRWINRRWQRMKVQEDSEGFIYLPGIRTDRFGRTSLSGPPRIHQQARRIGERPIGMQRRFGEPPPGGWQRGRIGTRAPLGRQH